jgi:hypothetical protein
MTRSQLEHIIRASGAIAEVEKLVIIGSQAILGPYPEAPLDLLSSMEADVFPLHKTERADLIDGSIGEDSFFHETFGYYAHGVSPEAAILPRNWKSRLINIQNDNTNNIEGLCLAPVDIAVSKLLAGRRKDLDFVKKMIEFNMVSTNEINKVSQELPQFKQTELKEVASKITRN